MSSTLYWRPVEQTSGCLGNGLKRAIGSYKFGGDGSCWENSIILNTSDVPFLNGLLHAGISEAKDLIDLIHQHESLELYLEY